MDSEALFEGSWVAIYRAKRRVTILETLLIGYLYSYLITTQEPPKLRPGDQQLQQAQGDLADSCSALGCGGRRLFWLSWGRLLKPDFGFLVAVLKTTLNFEHSLYRDD